MTAHRYLFALLSAVCIGSLAADGPAAAPDTARLERFNKDLRDAGAVGVKMLSFEFANKAAAYSAIVLRPDQKDGPIYAAELQESVDGVEIVFRVHKDCVLTPAADLTEKSIRVNDQKIGVYYSCSRSGSDTQQIFMARTAAGRQALYQAFRDRRFVFTELAGTEIPFDTAGFKQAWEKASEPAL